MPITLPAQNRPVARVNEQDPIDGRSEASIIVVVGEIVIAAIRV